MLGDGDPGSCPIRPPREVGGMSLGPVPGPAPTFCGVPVIQGKRAVITFVISLDSCIFSSSFLNIVQIASNPDGSMYDSGLFNAYAYVLRPPHKPIGSLVTYLPVCGS